MSHNMIKLIENIFNALEDAVSENLSLPIPNKRRKINPNQNYGDKVSDILKYSNCKTYIMTHTIKCFLISYEGNYYLFYPYDFDLGGTSYVNEDYFQEGFGLLAMGNSFLTPYDNKLYEIYNNILASNLDNFNFNDISCYYPSYTIIQDVPETNELKYVEDVFRITASYLTNNLTYTTNILTQKTYENLLLVLKFKSSRSISSCIIRCLDSSLLDHCFLELYRCIEFLFYLQISFDIGDKYKDINLDAILDLVCNREIFKKEQDTLEAIIKRIEKSESVSIFYDFLTDNKYIASVEDNKQSDKKSITNKSHFIAIHIYELRCKTAHLSYKHEYIAPNYKWRESIEYLSNIILDIYSDLDQKVIERCNINQVWTHL